MEEMEEESGTIIKCCRDNTYMIHSYDDIQQVIVYVIVIRNTVQQKREKQTFKVFSKNVPTVHLM